MISVETKSAGGAPIVKNLVQRLANPVHLGAELHKSKQQSPTSSPGASIPALPGKRKGARRQPPDPSHHGPMNGLPSRRPSVANAR